MDNVEDIYPLTPVQAGMLLHTLEHPASGHYLTQMTWPLAADVDPAALRAAWETVVSWHPVLRTSFVWDDVEEPLQIVWRTASLDWSENREPGDPEDWFARDRARGLDLSRPPAQRLHLRRDPAQAPRLTWTFSHLLLDGWSARLVWQDVQTAYRAAREGRLPDPPARRPFRDFVARQRDRDLSAAETFWRERFAGRAGPCRLESVHAPPPSAPRGSGRVDLRIDPAVTRRLVDEARRHRVTLNTLVQAAWGLLLARHGLGPDVVFGVTSSGRPADLEGAEAMVGLFINTLPLRLEVDETRPLSDWMRDVRDAQARLLQFESSPLARVQQWAGLPAGEPPFDTILVFENFPGRPTLAPATAEPDVREHSHYPLALLVLPGSALDLILIHDRARFDDAWTERCGRHLRTILEGMAAGLDRPATALAWLDTDELHTLVSAWGQTPPTPPSHDTALPLFRPRCAKPGGGEPGSLAPRTVLETHYRNRPDAPAVTDARRTLSYGELGRVVGQLAARLAAAGVEPGDRVAVFSDWSADFVVAILAAWEAGAAYVPLDASYPSDWIRRVLADSEPAAVVGRSDLVRRLPADPPVLRVLLEDAGPDGPRVGPRPFPDDRSDPAAYLLYTSGSSGGPKGVLVSHSNLEHSTRARQRHYASPVTTFLLLSSFAFDSSVAGLFWTLADGGHLCIPPGERYRDMDELASWLLRHRVSHLLCVPTLYRHLLDDAAAALGPVRTVIVAGEACPPDLVRRHHAARPEAGLHNEYGPTEATVWSTVHECRPEDARGPVPIGRPIPGTSVLVLGPDRRVLPVGVTGELWVGGPGVAQGYWKRTDLTSERFPTLPEFPGRWYRTGDLVAWNPDGTLHFLGRLDDQIKIHGLRIEPSQIAEALLRIPGLRTAEILLLPPPHPAQSPAAAGSLTAPSPPGQLTACYTADADRDLSPADLIRHLESHLPPGMIPRRFVRVAAWPRLPNGKVDRRQLAALAAADAAARNDRGSSVPVRTTPNELEARILRVWEAVLRRPAIGLDDPFFALGGDSIHALRILGRLGTDLPGLTLGLILRRPTVRELAAALEPAAPSPPPPPETPIEPVPPGQSPPLSHEQERLWFLHHTLADTATYHTATVARLRGPLDRPRLERSFAALAQRHPSLRTAFVNTENGPLQRVFDQVPVSLPVTVLPPTRGPDRHESVPGLVREEIRRPFDLDTPPLFRLRLIQLGPDDHVLVLTLHHLVCDEWSVGLLLDELLELWRSPPGPPPRPIPPVTYADYAWTQRHRPDPVARERGRAYWQAALQGVPASIELPVARASPADSGRGGILALDLDPATAAALERLGHAENATPFMVWLAAFHAWLHRITAQLDLATAVPVSLRHGPQLASVVGFFVNTLPLRSRIDHATPFVALLREVRERVHEALEHRALPFDEILRAGGIPPDGRGPGSIAVAFVHQPAAPAFPNLPGITAEPMETDTGTAKFDLTLFLAQRGPRAWRATFEYRTERFDQDDLRWLQASFVTLLHHLATTPDLPVLRIPLLSEAGAARARAEHERNRVPYPRDATLTGLFDARVRETPDAEAVVDGRQRWTYRELDRRSRHLAHRLRALGVRAGDRVALHLDRSPEFVAAVLATLALGAAYVPLPTDFPVPRQAWMLADTGAAAVVTRGPLPEGLADAGRPVLDLATEPAPAEAGFDPQPGPDVPVPATAAAYVMYTSGSSGQPKGVVVPHRAVVRLVCGTDYLPWGPQERFLLFASTAFDASTLELWGPLLHGGTCVVAPAGATDLDALGHLLAIERITFLLLTTGLFNRIIDTAPALLRPVRNLLSGGEAMSVPHARRALETLPETRLINGYGPTESATLACTHLVGWPDCSPDAPSIPIGRPIANTSCLLLDPFGQPVPDGMPGELHLGGDGLALGYLNQPALTADRFVPDPTGSNPGSRWYRTGDRCRRRRDGTLEFLGRLDDQVKIRGFRVEPAEIETALRTHPAVRQASVVARPRTDGTRELVAFVVADPGTADLESLRSHLRAQLPDPFVPAHFVPVETIPLTPQGKVDRAALLAAGATGLSSTRPFVAPRDRDECVLAAIWSSLLDRERVGIHDDFFALGGHSLLALRMVFEIRQRLGWVVAVSTLLAHPTIATLAPVARSAAADGQPIRGSGDGPPVYFVPGVPGVNYLPTELLASVGAAARYCDTLQFPGIDGREEPLDTVEALATALIGKLRAIQPSGPFCLAGYSFGGNVAFEMARQLEAAGSPPPLVLLFDAFVPGTVRARTLPQAVRATARHLRRLGPAASVRFLRDHLLGKVRSRHAQIVQELGLAASTPAPAPTTPATSVDQIRKRVFDASLRAFASHRPQPYRGRVVLFRSLDRDVAFGVFREVDPTNGWTDLARGPLEIEDIPGDHWHVLAEGHAAYAARRAAAHLAALNRPSPPAPLPSDGRGWRRTAAPGEGSRPGAS